MNTTLKGQTAIVTGGSRGIGKAIVEELAARGAAVAFTYNSNEAAANAVVQSISSSGGRAAAYKADVSVAGEVQQLIDSVLSEFTTIDILVNNAGITKDGLLMRMAESDWDAVVDTNLKGIFLTTKAAIRQMMSQKRGKIINLTSVVALSGNPGQANYCASKAGVIGFTKSIAKEVASRGITVNAVAPGYIETDMTGKLNEQQREAMMAMIPLKRSGKPEDIAKTVAFLASDDASYITGQTIVVDGGMVM